MYSFQVFKNGKQVNTTHTGSTNDEVIAYEIWDKMQLHYETLWSLFAYSYSISMLKDGQVVHHIDYEV